MANDSPLSVIRLFVMTWSAPQAPAQAFDDNDDVTWHSDYDDTELQSELQTWDSDFGDEAIDGDGYAGYESDDFGFDDGLYDDNFSNDDFGEYDSDYDWGTDDEGFSDWFGDSDELF